MIHGPRSPHIADRRRRPLKEPRRRFASFDEELATRLRELADTLCQGESLATGLAISAAMSERPRLRALFRRMLDFEERGLFFDRALRAAPVRLDPDACVPLRLGMSVGEPASTLRRFAGYLEDLRARRRRIIVAGLKLLAFTAYIFALVWAFAAVYGRGAEVLPWAGLGLGLTAAFLAVEGRKLYAQSPRLTAVAFLAAYLNDQIKLGTFKPRELLAVLESWRIEPAVLSDFIAALHRRVAPPGSPGFPSFASWLAISERGRGLDDPLRAIHAAPRCAMALDDLLEVSSLIAITLSSPVGLGCALYVGAAWLAAAFKKRWRGSESAFRIEDVIGPGALVATGLTSPIGLGVAAYACAAWLFEAARKGSA